MICCCTGCNIVLDQCTNAIVDGEDGQYTIMCTSCGHSMKTNGRRGLREFTRAEWKALAEQPWFELWKDEREKIVERMIG